MIPAGNSKPNIERFLGFQDEYDRYRPEAPPIVVELLTQYLGRRPSLVADVGCGTGLSTFPWKDAADTVTGVEPNPDMLGKALENLSLLEASAPSLSFSQRFSKQLPFSPASVDLTTCSHS
ncbi:SAM-dependent methyltransferase, partial [Paenibacillus riograndensis]